MVAGEVEDRGVGMLIWRGLVERERAVGCCG